MGQNVKETHTQKCMKTSQYTLCFASLVMSHFNVKKKKKNYIHCYFVISTHFSDSISNAVLELWSIKNKVISSIQLSPIRDKNTIFYTRVIYPNWPAWRISLHCWSKRTSGLESALDKTSTKHRATCRNQRNVIILFPIMT